MGVVGGSGNVFSLKLKVTDLSPFLMYFMESERESTLVFVTQLLQIDLLFGICHTGCSRTLGVRHVCM